MKKAGLYVRLSDEDEGKMRKEDLSESIINQKSLLEEYARNNGFTVYDVYCDDDYSGLYDERPGFQKLLNDAKDGKFGTIIAKSQSRFSRNMEHIEHYLHQLFEEWNIRFIGVVDGVDTAVESNKKARQIYGLTNEWYCEDLSKNIRAVFNTKMNLGQYIGSFAPFGYEKDSKDKNHLIVDDEAAATVRRIFHLFIEVQNIDLISNTLFKEHVPTPAIYKKSKGLTYKYKQKYDYCETYGLWSSTTIRRILQDEVYLGHTVQGKTKKATYKSKRMKRIPKDEWIIVKNTHQPIIPKDDFDLVQKILKNRRRVEKKGKVPRPLSGKLKCAECGSSIVNCGSTKNGSRIYMDCQLAKKSKSSFCSPHRFILQDIEQVVLNRIQNMIKDVIANENHLQELAEILKIQDQGLDKKKELENKIRVADEKLAEIKAALKSLYLDKAKGIIDEVIYLEMSDEFQKDIKKYSADLETGTNEMNEFLQDNKKIKDYCEMAKKYCYVETLSTELVNRFVDHIEITEKDEDEKMKVIIHWNI